MLHTIPDWIKEGQLPSVDVLTMHLYWRQTEGVPDKGWTRMGWNTYLAFVKAYMRVRRPPYLVAHFFAL